MALKSWGLQLWDQVDKVFIYCNQGLEQTELFHKAVTDIHKIYCGLARKHKALGSPVNTGKSKLVLETSTYLTSFNNLVSCMHDQGGVYELKADEIKNQTLAPLKVLIDDLKSGFNMQFQEYNKFKANIETQKRSLDRAWSRYYTAFIVKKRGENNYGKIKDDKTVPRVEIEKVQGIANQKKHDFEKVRGEYALVLQTFNDARGLLYLKDLAKLCSVLEMLDRKRAEVTTKAGLALVEVAKDTLTRCNECSVERVRQAIDGIDHRTDAAALVASLQGSAVQPADLVFVDLDSTAGGSGAFSSGEVPGLLQQGGKVEKNDTAKSLFGGPGLRGLELKDLLPEQTKRRLSDLQESIKAMEKQLVGLKTLFQTFEKDPAMGDKSSLEPEIDVNERQLTSLREMEADVVRYLEQHGNSASRPSNGSRIISATAKPTPPHISRGKSVSSTATGDSDDDSFDGDEDEDEQERVTSPAVTASGAGGGIKKKANVMYTFDAVDNQQMSIQADTTVFVLSYDDAGSGWTLAQHATDPTNKGYVPTNYIQIID